MFKYRIAGIPCQINVISCTIQKPMGYWAPSPEDCYGYTEIVYEVYDRKGYKADWLAKKITPRIDESICVEIQEMEENKARE